MIEQWFSCSEEIFSCKIFALYNDGELYVCQTLPTYRQEEARLNFLIFLTFVWLGKRTSGRGSREKHCRQILMYGKLEKNN